MKLYHKPLGVLADPKEIRGRFSRPLMLPNVVGVTVGHHGRITRKTAMQNSFLRRTKIRTIISSFHCKEFLSLV